ncbi:hypothetical protein BN134_11 [Cronobacter dublinensis 1210]|uniref:Uncharacterized protein n=1 Tax=Cronobacter dublinensis 1210 TaxID=1208656 RepID=A0ABM9Q1R9_9ENTR|nr:hypothetical protein BN134_11 [Cronobacter dublinensis 1210]CCJ86408.1 hypothetical protein BN133_2785 [Cronobacter dublinensis 582]
MVNDRHTLTPVTAPGGRQKRPEQRLLPPFASRRYSRQL